MSGELIPYDIGPDERAPGVPFNNSVPRAPMGDADREFLRRFVDFVTADGFGTGSVATRLERLKFETIVTGKTIGEVLAEDDGAGHG